MWIFMTEKIKWTKMFDNPIITESHIYDRNIDDTQETAKWKEDNNNWLWMIVNDYKESIYVLS